jgi:hypothetical protein
VRPLARQYALRIAHEHAHAENARESSGIMPLIIVRPKPSSHTRHIRMLTCHMSQDLEKLLGHFDAAAYLLCIEVRDGVRSKPRPPK